MHAQVAIVACLAFSGFSALVYQVLWTRLLGSRVRHDDRSDRHRARRLLRRARARQPARGALDRAPAPAAAASTPCSSSAIGVFALASLPLLEQPGERCPGSRGRRARAGRPRCSCAASRRRPCCCRRPSRWARPCRWSRAAWSRDDARLGRASAILYALEHARRRARRLPLRLLDDPGAGPRPLGAGRGRREPRGGRGCAARGAAAPRRPPPSGAASAASRAPSAASASVPDLLRGLRLRRDRLRDPLVEGLRHRDGGHALRLRRRARGIPARHRARQRRDRGARRPHPPAAARLRAAAPRDRRRRRRRHARGPLPSLRLRAARAGRRRRRHRPLAVRAGAAARARADGALRRGLPRADPALRARRRGRRPRDRRRDGGQHRGQHRREPRS